MENNLKGYVKFTHAIIGKYSDEDMLPIREHDIHAIEELLSSRLGEKHIKVLHMSFGLDGQEATRAEIADILNISQSRVGQLEEKALRILRHPANSNVFKKLYRSHLEAIIARQRKDLTEAYSSRDSVEKELNKTRMLKQLNEEALFCTNREVWKSLVRDMHEYIIEDIPHFSVRTQRCLKENNIIKVRDLVRKTEEDLRSFPQFGAKSFNEVKDFLYHAGLELSKEE
ncbi:MAG TPA: hypothetical protein DEA43_01940 [Candidatus Moranbacteria bacterium]|nr:hypothetical protein [Candidatus Moranbacteria bacterium]HBT45629.1 hypothetical protein [Candidatus Moranbacteria bacterium]